MYPATEALDTLSELGNWLNDHVSRKNASGIGPSVCIELIRVQIICLLKVCMCQSVRTDMLF